MNPSVNNLIVLFRQELKEIIYSRLLWLISLIYLAFFFIFIVVGTRESAIMGFTGMNRVLFSWSHALVFFLPLLALTTSATVITQYRENGSLEFFLSQPVSRRTFFLALTVARFLALLFPLMIVLILSILWGLISELNFQVGYGIKFLLVSGALIWCFLSIGLFLSERCRSQVRALVLMILVWIAAVTLVDFILIGLMLQFNFTSALFFFITEINPVQASRLALLIDVDDSLSTLGPVGFFIVNRIGESSVLAIGVFWPLVLGTVFWLITKAHFQKNDLI